MQQDFDVIVAGAGGSGLAAAYSAAQHGGKVLVLEKRSQPGGTTGIACSVIGIGEGVNAENIAGCIEMLKDAKWDGALSIECEAAPGKIEQSIEWLRKEIAR